MDYDDMPKYRRVCVSAHVELRHKIIIVIITKPIKCGTKLRPTDSGFQKIRRYKVQMLLNLKEKGKKEL